jgi:hypothetical protein
VPVTQVVEVERLWFKVNPGKVIRHYCTKKKKRKENQRSGEYSGRKICETEKKFKYINFDMSIKNEYGNI